MERLDTKELELVEQYLIGRIIALREIELTTQAYVKIFGKRKDLYSMVVNVELLSKLKAGGGGRYSAIELAIINNCVNRNLRYLRTKMLVYDDSKWFTGTQEEREWMITMSICKNILRKTGFAKKYGRQSPDFNFNTNAVCEVVDKINKSTHVLIHKSMYGKVDSIVFIYNNSEKLEVKPGDDLHISDMSFTNIPQNLSQEGYARERCAVLAPRKTAIVILENSEVDYYSKEVRELIYAMLGNSLVSNRVDAM